MITFVSGAICFVMGLSLAPPPPPPLGWESEITEGFDPPIEETLVDGFYADDAARNAHIEAWGDDAVPVLQGLYADSKWAAYHRLIRDYLNRLDAPATTEDALERLETVLTEFPPGSIRRLEALDTAMADAMRGEPEQAREMFLEAFATADAETQGWLLRAAVTRGSPERAALLEELLPSAQSDDIRSNIERSLAHTEAAARVREPIALILERERQESAP